MALISFEDVQEERNIDLTDPNGQVVATKLIEAATAWISRYVGYPIEQDTHVYYYTDGYRKLWLPTKAPVSSVLIERRVGSGYEALSVNSYDWAENGEVEVRVSLPTSLKSTRITYTAGWTSATVPADLRGAIIDIVALNLQGISNFSSTDSGSSEGEGGSSGGGGGGITRVTAGSYTEEYSNARNEAYWKAKTAQLSRTVGDGIPSSVREVVAGYRLPLAL